MMAHTHVPPAADCSKKSQMLSCRPDNARSVWSACQSTGKNCISSSKRWWEWGLQSSSWRSLSVERGRSYLPPHLSHPWVMLWPWRYLTEVSTLGVAKRLCGCSVWSHRASESTLFLSGQFVDSPLPAPEQRSRFGTASAIPWCHVLCSSLEVFPTLLSTRVSSVFAISIWLWKNLRGLENWQLCQTLCMNALIALIVRFANINIAMHWVLNLLAAWKSDLGASGARFPPQPRTGSQWTQRIK